MLGSVGKKYAKAAGQKVEELTLNALNEHAPQEAKTKEIATREKLHKISGKRKALFIGINYVGQKNELK